LTLIIQPLISFLVFKVYCIFKYSATISTNDVKFISGLCHFVKEQQKTPEIKMEKKIKEESISNVSNGFDKSCEKQDHQDHGFDKSCEKKDHQGHGFDKSCEKKDYQGHGFDKSHDKKDHQKHGSGKSHEKMDNQKHGSDKSHEKKVNQNHGSDKSHEKKDHQKHGSDKSHDKRDSHRTKIENDGRNDKSSSQEGQCGKSSSMENHDAKCSVSNGYTYLEKSPMSLDGESSATSLHLDKSPLKELGNGKSQSREGHHHSKHHKHKHKHKHHSSDRTPVKQNSEDSISRIRHSDFRNSPCKIDDTDPISHSSIRILGKKKVLNNCGIQVCLKRRTENKCIQVNLKGSKDNHSSSHSSSKSAKHHERSKDHHEKSKDHHDKSKDRHLSCESSNITKHQEKSKEHHSSQSSSHMTKHHDKSKKHVSHQTSKSEEKPRSMVDIMHNKNTEASRDYTFRKLKSAKNSGDPFSDSKYRKLFHLEKCPNGGALVLHVYQDELRNLSAEDMTKFVSEYFDFVYGENPEGVAHCVMGIVHRSAVYMPDFIDYFADKYPTMHCKSGMMGKSDIDSTTISKYREHMLNTYKDGTHRSGPLMQISVVGTVHEEVGDYFPEFLDMVEKNAFLKAVMPWGERSIVAGMQRNVSNDGPILWSRPGEQMVPTADMPKSPFKRKR